MSWPPEVERVARALREAAIEARLEEFPEGTPTAADAATAAGCDLADIVKSLLFACDGRWTLAMVPGDRRADKAKVAAAAGAQKAAVASAAEVARVTGFETGGVAPFPLPGVSAVLIEQTLLARTVLWIGAGTPRHMAALAPGDLVKVSRARSADLVSENGD
jgi:prolyl-tRNA editing enzyme YbaK/EbsC (Cys-tRNA(Pro) deacylase)